MVLTSTPLFLSFKQETLILSSPKRLQDLWLILSHDDPFFIIHRQAFEEEFPRLPDINKAIMNITESGKLLELENKYINSEECVDADSIPEEDASIGLNSFSILFALTGCTSTIALGVYVVRYFLISLPKQRILFRAFAKRWRHYRRQLSARVISVENPRNPPDDPYWEARHSFSTVSDIESLEDNLEP